MCAGASRPTTDPHENRLSRFDFDILPETADPSRAPAEIRASEDEIVKRFEHAHERMAGTMYFC